ncbi:hypothetical protein [Nocardia africana]|uniref:Transcriptional regulator, Acidobacterial, PadR-family n=1 Tax=Nocardia africana TaxID=134964 RepID=A0ABW6NTI6_9NOCA
MRSTADIAAELGIGQMTVNLALPRFGIPVRPQGVHSRTEMLASLDDTIPAGIRTVVEGTLHGWQRLHRYQIAMAFPTLHTASDYLGLPSGSLVTQINQLETALDTQLFHRAVYRKPQHPTDFGHQLLTDLTQPQVRQLMAAALHQLTPMPDPKTLAEAQRKVAAPRRPGTALRPFKDIPVARLPMTRPLRTILADLLTHHPEQFYGQQLHQRTGIDTATIYPLLRRMEKAGWLTSWPEPEHEWLAGAPPGCGPGRRRTYYQLTHHGHRAATHELNHPRRNRKTNATPQTQNQ